jgi:hypothetical protein
MPCFRQLRESATGHLVLLVEIIERNLFQKREKETSESSWATAHIFYEPNTRCKRKRLRSGRRLVVSLFTPVYPLSCISFLTHANDLRSLAPAATPPLLDLAPRRTWHLPPPLTPVKLGARWWRPGGAPAAAARSARDPTSPPAAPRA